MTEQEQSDYVAAKMGIIFLCENCRKCVHSIADKAGNIIGWIHTESEGVVCDATSIKPTHAAPASLQTLTDMFEPKPVKITPVKMRKENGNFYVEIENDYFEKLEDLIGDYKSFTEEYDKWDYK